MISKSDAEYIKRRDQLKSQRLIFSKAKLKAVTRTSTVLCGFAMITMVEISLDEHKDSTRSMPLLIIYSIVTCLLVGVHLLALIISKCVMTQLNASALFHHEYHPNMEIFIEIAWILSTGVGLFLFLFEISLVCWIKFFFVTHQAAIGTTVILIPVMILFWIFAFHFYRRLVRFKLNHHQNELDQIESIFLSERISLVKNI